MTTIYLTAVVPAAYLDAVRLAIAPTLYSGAKSAEIAVPLWPAGDSQAGPPTHYGTCAPIPGGGMMDAAADALVASVPGCHAARVDPAKYDHAADWFGWLAGLGLAQKAWPPLIERMGK